jgi:hypothetical protein
MSIPEPAPFQLDPGETLIWSGTPRNGIVFSPSDALQIPIGLLLLFVFANQSRHASFGGPADVAIFCGLLVVLMYFLVGRFVFDAYGRRRTRYALTSERVLIRESVRSEFVKSFPLNTITDTLLRERRNGFGDVWFGRRYLPVGWQDTRLQPRTGRPNGFSMIADASHVHELLEAARLTRPAPTARSLMEGRQQ